MIQTDFFLCTLCHCFDSSHKKCVLFNLLLVSIEAYSLLFVPISDPVYHSDLLRIYTPSRQLRSSAGSCVLHNFNATCQCCVCVGVHVCKNGDRWEWEKLWQWDWMWEFFTVPTEIIFTQLFHWFILNVTFWVDVSKTNYHFYALYNQE